MVDYVADVAHDVRQYVVINFEAPEGADDATIQAALREAWESREWEISDEQGDDLPTDASILAVREVWPDGDGSDPLPAFENVDLTPESDDVAARRAIYKAAPDLARLLSAIIRNGRADTAALDVAIQEAESLLARLGVDTSANRGARP